MASDLLSGSKKGDSHSKMFDIGVLTGSKIVVDPAEVVDSLAVGVAVLDQNLCINLWNSKMEELTGSKNVIGKSFPEVMTENFMKSLTMAGLATITSLANGLVNTDELLNQNFLPSCTSTNSNVTVVGSSGPNSSRRGADSAAPGNSGASGTPSVPSGANATNDGDIQNTSNKIPSKSHSNQNTSNLLHRRMEDLKEVLKAIYTNTFDKNFISREIFCECESTETTTSPLLKAEFPVYTIEFPFQSTIMEAGAVGKDHGGGKTGAVSVNINANASGNSTLPVSHGVVWLQMKVTRRGNQLLCVVHDISNTLIRNCKAVELAMELLAILRKLSPSMTSTFAGKLSNLGGPHLGPSNLSPNSGNLGAAGFINAVVGASSPGSSPVDPPATSNWPRSSSGQPSPHLAHGSLQSNEMSNVSNDSSLLKEQTVPEGQQLVSVGQQPGRQLPKDGIVETPFHFLDHCGSPCFSFDHDLNIRFWNKAMSRLTGCSECVGHQIENYISPERLLAILTANQTKDQHRLTITVPAQKQQNGGGEIASVEKRTIELLVSVTDFWFESPSGESPGLVLIGQDITALTQKIRDARTDEPAFKDRTLKEGGDILKGPILNGGGVIVKNNQGFIDSKDGGTTSKDCDFLLWNGVPNAKHDDTLNTQINLHSNNGKVSDSKSGSALDKTTDSKGSCADSKGSHGSKAISEVSKSTSSAGWVKGTEPSVFGVTKDTKIPAFGITNANASTRIIVENSDMTKDTSLGRNKNRDASLDRSDKSDREVTSESKSEMNMSSSSYKSSDRVLPDNRTPADSRTPQDDRSDRTKQGNISDRTPPDNRTPPNYSRDPWGMSDSSPLTDSVMTDSDSNLDFDYTRAGNGGTNGVGNGTSRNGDLQNFIMEVKRVRRRRRKGGDSGRGSGSGGEIGIGKSNVTENIEEMLSSSGETPRQEILVHEALPKHATTIRTPPTPGMMMPGIHSAGEGGAIMPTSAGATAGGGATTLINNLLTGGATGAIGGSLTNFNIGTVLGRQNKDHSAHAPFSHAVYTDKGKLQALMVEKNKVPEGDFFSATGIRLNEHNAFDKDGKFAGRENAYVPGLSSIAGGKGKDFSHTQNYEVENFLKGKNGMIIEKGKENAVGRDEVITIAGQTIIISAGGLAVGKGPDGEDIDQYGNKVHESKQTSTGKDQYVGSRNKAVFLGKEEISAAGQDKDGKAILYAKDRLDFMSSNLTTLNNDCYGKNASMLFDQVMKGSNAAALSDNAAQFMTSMLNSFTDKGRDWSGQVRNAVAIGKDGLEKASALQVSIGGVANKYLPFNGATTGQNAMDLPASAQLSQSDIMTKGKLGSDGLPISKDTLESKGLLGGKDASLTRSLLGINTIPENVALGSTNAAGGVFGSSLGGKDGLGASTLLQTMGRNLPPSVRPAEGEQTGILKASICGKDVLIGGVMGGTDGQGKLGTDMPLNGLAEFGPGGRGPGIAGVGSAAGVGSVGNTVAGIQTSMVGGTVGNNSVAAEIGKGTKDSTSIFEIIGAGKMGGRFAEDESTLDNLQRRENLQRAQAEKKLDPNQSKNPYLEKINRTLSDREMQSDRESVRQRKQKTKRERDAAAAEQGQGKPRSHWTNSWLDANRATIQNTFFTRKAGEPPKILSKFGKEASGNKAGTSGGGTGTDVKGKPAPRQSRLPVYDQLLKGIEKEKEAGLSGSSDATSIASGDAKLPARGVPGNQASPAGSSGMGSSGVGSAGKVGSDAGHGPGSGQGSSGIRSGGSGKGGFGPASGSLSAGSLTPGITSGEFGTSSSDGSNQIDQIPVDFQPGKTGFPESVLHAAGKAGKAGQLSQGEGKAGASAGQSATLLSQGKASGARLLSPATGSGSTSGSATQAEAKQGKSGIISPPAVGTTPVAGKTAQANAFSAHWTTAPGEADASNSGGKPPFPDGKAPVPGGKAQAKPRVLGPSDRQQRISSALSGDEGTVEIMKRGGTPAATDSSFALGKGKAKSTAVALNAQSVLGGSTMETHKSLDAMDYTSGQDNNQSKFFSRSVNDLLPAVVTGFDAYVYANPNAGTTAEGNVESNLAMGNQNATPLSPNSGISKPKSAQQVGPRELSPTGGSLEVPRKMSRGVINKLVIADQRGDPEARAELQEYMQGNMGNAPMPGGNIGNIMMPGNMMQEGNMQETTGNMQGTMGPWQGSPNQMQGMNQMSGNMNSMNQGGIQQGVWQQNMSQQTVEHTNQNSQDGEKLYIPTDGNKLPTIEQLKKMSAMLGVNQYYIQQLLNTITSSQRQTPFHPSYPDIPNNIHGKQNQKPVKRSGNVGREYSDTSSWCQGITEEESSVASQSDDDDWDNNAIANAQSTPGVTPNYQGQPMQLQGMQQAQGNVQQQNQQQMQQLMEQQIMQMQNQQQIMQMQNQQLKGKQHPMQGIPPMEMQPVAMQGMQNQMQPMATGGMLNQMQTIPGMAQTSGGAQQKPQGGIYPKAQMQKALNSRQMANMEELRLSNQQMIRQMEKKQQKQQKKQLQLNQNNPNNGNNAVNVTLSSSKNKNSRSEQTKQSWEPTDEMFEAVARARGVSEHNNLDPKGGNFPGKQQTSASRSPPGQTPTNNGHYSSGQHASSSGHNHNQAGIRDSLAGQLHTGTLNTANMSMNQMMKAMEMMNNANNQPKSPKDYNLKDYGGANLSGANLKGNLTGGTYANSVGGSSANHGNYNGVKDYGGAKVFDMTARDDDKAKHTSPGSSRGSDHDRKNSRYNSRNADLDRVITSSIASYTSSSSLSLTSDEKRALEKLAVVNREMLEGILIKLDEQDVQQNPLVVKKIFKAVIEFLDEYEKKEKYQH